MNADDLLSFKEYSPVHDTHNSGGSAEININSPNRQPRSPYQNATTTTTTTATNNQSTLNDPLQDLLSSMSASVNVLQNDDRQRSTSSKFRRTFQLDYSAWIFGVMCWVPLFTGHSFCRWFSRGSTNKPFHIHHWILSTIFQYWCKCRLRAYYVGNNTAPGTRSICQTGYRTQSRSIWPVLDRCDTGKILACRQFFLRI